MAQKILVIDDDPSVVEIIQLTLESEGFQVSTATDSLEGVGMARREKPDLIFLDLSMPGLNGVEVCAQLKSDPRTKAIPIVMISARTFKEDVRRGLEAGVEAYVTKPFDPLTLRDVIQNILKRKISQ
ncbi:MAG: response regulator [Deltaproteobacteria bacterium]|nr:response regulator [Deltaproteobacteria bacterium]